MKICKILLKLKIFMNFHFQPNTFHHKYSNSFAYFASVYIYLYANVLLHITLMHITSIFGFPMQIFSGYATLRLYCSYICTYICI